MKKKKDAPASENAFDEELERDVDETPSEEYQADAELEKTRAERDEYLLLAQRVQAEFDNFRRRNQSARQESYDDGVREGLTALLPVLDNFERALGSAAAEDALAQGITMIHKQLLESADKLGLEEVPALGMAFDPELHHAVLQVETEDEEPGVVCEVLQKGYRARNRMLRYAMVKVTA